MLARDRLLAPTLENYINSAATALTPFALYMAISTTWPPTSLLHSLPILPSILPADDALMPRTVSFLLVAGNPKIEQVYTISWKASVLAWCPRRSVEGLVPLRQALGVGLVSAKPTIDLFTCSLVWYQGAVAARRPPLSHRPLGGT